MKKEKKPKKLPILTSDDEAEKFVANADGQCKGPQLKITIKSAVFYPADTGGGNCKEA